MERPSLIVELAGPAGSGKSTLAAALTKQDRNIQIFAAPNTRQVRDIPYFLWNLSLLLPTFFITLGDKNGGVLTRSQLAIMAILNGWHRRLRNVARKDGNIIVLDQGPVYMLAKLLQLPDKDLRRVAARWWDHTCRDWAEVLNIVVCLDAHDEDLLDRVRVRKKRHGFQNSTDEYAVDFLALCRLTQKEILSSIRCNDRGPSVVSFDTSSMTLSEVEERILALFQASIKS